MKKILGKILGKFGYVPKCKIEKSSKNIYNYFLDESIDNYVIRYNINEHIITIKSFPKEDDPYFAKLLAEECLEKLNE